MRNGMKWKMIKIENETLKIIERHGSLKRNEKRNGIYNEMQWIMEQGELETNFFVSCLFAVKIKLVFLTLRHFFASK